MLQTENYGFGLNNQTAAVDAHGRIQFDALPAGQRYGISFNAPGYGSDNTITR